MQPELQIMVPKGMLKAAIKRYGSLKAVCAQTGLRKSTLWRISTGRTTTPHQSTLDKLKELLA